MLTRRGLMIGAVVSAAYTALERGAAEAQLGFVMGPGTSYTGPGDLWSGAAGWWGLRAYNRATALAGANACQVKRNSDNAVLDIRVLATGGLDRVSLAAFLVSTTGTITRLYDQSGNGHDMILQTANAALVLQNAIGLLPGIHFAGNSGYASACSPPSGLNPRTLLLQTSQVITSSDCTALYHGGNTNGHRSAIGTHSGNWLFECTNIFVTGGTASAVQAIAAGYDGVNGFINVNGSRASNTISINTDPDSLWLGFLNVFGGINWLTGDVFEAAIYDSVDATKEAAVIANMQTYY